MKARFSSWGCGVLALLLCVACQPPGKPTNADIQIKPADVKDFDALYAQNCAGCHGREGKGSAAFALANPVFLAIASEDTIRRAVTSGVRGTLMPAFAKSAGGTLTEEQVAILAQNIHTRWAKPGVNARFAKRDALLGANPPPYAASEKGNAQKGATVYKIFCAGCHGPDGKGAEKGSSIVDGSFLALVSDQNLRTTIIAGRPDLGHPNWREDLPGRAMLPQEVTDVVAWLAAQRTPHPGQPYANNK